MRLSRGKGILGWTLIFCMPSLLWLPITSCAAGEKEEEQPVRPDPFSADNGNWKFLAKLEKHNPSQTIYIYSYSLDMVKVTPDGTVRMWFKFVPRELKLEGPPKPGGISYFLTREEVDCEKGIMRNLVIRDYNWYGEVIRESKEPLEWSPVAPETIGYEEYSAACESPQKIAHESWSLLREVGEFLDRITDKTEKR